jgi:Phthiocerol/phthiodiolone dimycocerosyl transferase C-terminus
MAREVGFGRRPTIDEVHAPQSERTASGAPALTLVPERQPLGASERFFVAQHRGGATNLTRVILLAHPPHPAVVARALRMLAARHRLLRTRVSEGARPSFVHGGGALPALHVVPRRSAHTFEEALRSVVNAPMDLAAGPVCQLHYVYTEGDPRAELIVAADHVVCDGVSMNALCAELLALCAGGLPARVARDLPVLEQLLPAASPLERARAVARSLARFARIQLCRRVAEARPRAESSDFLYAELSADETRALVERARSAGTTVTGALLAASLRAVRTQRPHTLRLAASVPVNLRPRLQDSALTPDDLANLTSAVYLDTTASLPMWPLARALKHDLAREVEGERFLNATTPVYQIGRMFTRGPRATLAHVMVSNSGTLPLRADYGAFQVVGFRSATSAPMLAADFALFCNTFDGRLCINLLFAPEVTSRQAAAEVLGQLRQHLIEAP